MIVVADGLKHVAVEQRVIEWRHLFAGMTNQEVDAVRWDIGCLEYVGVVEGEMAYWTFGSRHYHSGGVNVLAQELRPLRIPLMIALAVDRLYVRGMERFNAASALWSGAAACP